MLSDLYMSAKSPQIHATQPPAAGSFSSTPATHADFLPAYYAELRLMAKARIAGEHPLHAMQVTELVHEAYLRLAKQKHIDWSSRSDVLTLAAWMMRRILVDHAKSRKRQKRGDGTPVEALDLQIDYIERTDPNLELLDAALDRLSAVAPRQAAIVEMRFFAGLSVEETAAALEISTATVKREWKSARLWLLREIAN